MTALAVADLVIVTLVVLAAAGYMFWKLVLRQPAIRKPPVRVGGTLARGMARGRQRGRLFSKR